MPLMYAFIARGQDVLCEYAAFQGNFSKVAVECLAKCPAHNAKFTYNADKHTFNFIVFNGYSACCRAREPCCAARRCAFAAARHRVANSGASRLALRAAFLCVADEEYGRQIPFGFLEKVKDDFIKNYGETARSAVPMSLTRVYGCAPRAVAAPAAAQRTPPPPCAGLARRRGEP